MSEFERLASQNPDVAAIGKDITGQFGGFLRCETCRRVELLKGRYIEGGWPKCCGYTMRWWTQRQLDDGEVTP